LEHFATGVDILGYGISNYQMDANIAGIFKDLGTISRTR